MSAISTGLNVDVIDRTRSAIARIKQPDLVKPSSSEQSQSARFVYDREMKRSFVEFRDSESGRVISRFPAEQPDGGAIAQAVAKAKLLDILA